MDQITEKLWIGNWKDAVSEDQIHENFIAGVLSLTSTRRPPFFGGTTAHHVAIPDSYNASKKELLTSILLLDSLVEQTQNGILVHCTEGQSRSVGVTGAWRYLTEGGNLMDHINYISSIRCNKEQAKIQITGLWEKIQELDFNYIKKVIDH